MPFRAGQLDRMIALYKWAPTRDTDGGEVPGWAFNARVPASYKAVKGYEQVEGGQITASAIDTYTIRFMTVDVRDKFKVINPDGTEGQEYDIQDTTVLGRRNEMLVITAVARQVSS